MSKRGHIPAKYSILFSQQDRDLVRRTIMRATSVACHGENATTIAQWVEARLKEQAATFGSVSIAERRGFRYLFFSALYELADQTEGGLVQDGRRFWNSTLEAIRMRQDAQAMEDARMRRLYRTAEALEEKYGGTFNAYNDQYRGRGIFIPMTQIINIVEDLGIFVSQEAY